MAPSLHEYDQIGHPGLPSTGEVDAADAHLTTDGVRSISFTKGRLPRLPRWRQRQARAEREFSAVRWLRNAMIALGVLAAAAAVVSFAAQYEMILAAKGSQVIAALEAGIPDAAAAIFACLGIALALYGKRAIRPRVLNLAAVATSVFMNWAAAGPGWRDAAIWIMPPLAYAVASDTMIGVVRAWAIARARREGVMLSADDTSPLAITAGVGLWLLRLLLAPFSTLWGFRGWVVEECPVAPGRKGTRKDKKAKHATGNGGQRKPWNDLTPAYRQRLLANDIDQAAYEGGASLAAARGHR